MQMWKSKWLKSFFNLLLLLLGFLLTGEMTAKQLTGCEPYCTVSFEWDAFGHTAEELRVFQEMFREKNVELIAQVSTYDRAADVYQYDLYGSEQGFATFSEDTTITEGRIYSVFGADTEYHFYDYEELEHCTAEYVKFHLVSDDDLRHTLPADWVLELGMDDISGKNVNIRARLEKNMYQLWALIFLITLVFVYYDCLQQKKSFFVQVAYGDSLQRLIGVNILFDSCVYGLFFFVLGAVTSSWIMLPYGWRTFGVIGALFLLGNALMYVPLLRYSFREALSGTTLSRKELSVSYLLHAVVLVATVVLLCMNTELIRQYKEYKKQDAFYSSRKDMYTFASMSRDDMLYLMDCYYLEHVDEGDVEMFLPFTRIEDANKQLYLTIKMNKNSLDWLKEQLPAIQGYDFSAGNVICLYPDVFQTTEPDFFSNNVSVFHVGGVTEEPDVVAYSYPAGFQLPLMNGNDFSQALSWEINPIIVMDMRDNMAAAISCLETLVGSGNYPMYIFRLEPSEHPQAVLHDQSVADCVSVYEAYAAQLQAYYRGYVWELCILALLLFLELSVVLKIIRLEFETNAKQYILQRLFGENIFRTYQTLFASTLALYGVGYVLSVFVLKQVGAVSFNTALIALLVLLVCEMFVILSYVLYMERIAKQKVLKGGCL